MGGSTMGRVSPYTEEEADLCHLAGPKDFGRRFPKILDRSEFCALVEASKIILE